MVEQAYTRRGGGDAALAAGTLTPLQRDVLASREHDLFGEGAAVTGHASTLRSLRRRCIIAGSQPNARLTSFGQAVIAAAGLDGGADR